MKPVSSKSASLLGLLGIKPHDSCEALNDGHILSDYSVSLCVHDKGQLGEGGHALKGEGAA